MWAAVVGGLIQLVGCTPQFCSCLCKEYDFVKNIDENFKELSDEVESLHGIRDDVKIEIQRDTRMVPTNETIKWLQRIKPIEYEFKKLETKYKKSSCGGWYPPCCQLNLSKKMVKLREEIILLKHEDIKTRILVEQLPPPVVPVHQPIRIKDKPSLKAVVEKIMGYLRDDSLKRIGIYGSSGVGKTTVMKQVNNDEIIKILFQTVIWVNVKKNRTIQDMQQQIVERLQLNVQGIEGIDGIARRITEALQNKKYLLLLDDVSESFNLEDVGIFDNGKGSKVVFTTLYCDICGQMDTCEEIKVDRLSEKEAFNLFMEKAGDIANKPRFKELVPRLLKECGGYMGVIVVVASALKKLRSEDLWRSQLIRLRERNTPETKCIDEVLRALRLGYDLLPDDGIKNCFLYEALYPEEHEIYADYLMELWKAEGFIVGEDNLGYARDKGKGILRDLIRNNLLESKCLLEKSYRVRCVKMPRLLRNLALSIKSANDVNCKLLVRSGEDLQETPDEEEWKNINRISLMHNKLSSLPESPECCNLSTLLLQCNSSLMSIPDSFFDNMGSLLVLDLHGTGISSLPPSLFSLIRLKGLYLNDCNHLLELPIEISKLVNLEVLDIRGTMIHYLPIELQLARRLRCLRVSFGMNNVTNGTPSNIHQQVEMIPQGLLSELRSLEELRIDVNLHDKRWNQIVDFAVQNISVLNEMKDLQFYFPTIESLRQFVTNSRSWKTENSFTYFKFVVGSHDISPYPSHILQKSEYLIERYLRFSAGNGIPNPVLQVLVHVDALEFVNLKNVVELSEIHTKKMGGLKICVIEGCNNMVTFINNTGNGNADRVLPHIEKLKLINLPLLRSIWEGHVQPKSFGGLTTLTLKGCSKLEKIFSQGLISQLAKLEELTVDDCSGIKEIINETDNPILECDTLPALHSLVLVKLPELVSICQNVSLNWPSLEKIQISSCDKLKKLPFRRDGASNLSGIKCDRTWWSALDWTGVTDEAKICCQTVLKTRFSWLASMSVECLCNWLQCCSGKWECNRFGSSDFAINCFAFLA